MGRAKGLGGKTLERLPATGIIFRETPGDYDSTGTPRRAGSTSSTSTAA